MLKASHDRADRASSSPTFCSPQMLGNTIEKNIATVQAPWIRLTWCPARRVTGNNDLKTWRVETSHRQVVIRNPMNSYGILPKIRPEISSCGNSEVSKPKAIKTKPKISNHIDHLLPWSWLVQRPLRFMSRFQTQIEELMEHWKPLSLQVIWVIVDKDLWILWTSWRSWKSKWNNTANVCHQFFEPHLGVQNQNGWQQCTQCHQLPITLACWLPFKIQGPRLQKLEVS